MAEIELEGKDNEILSELSIWFDAQELVLDGLHYKIKDYHVFAEKVEEKLKTLAIGKRPGQKRGFNLLRLSSEEGFKDVVGAFWVVPIKIGDGKPTAANKPLVFGKALLCNGPILITPSVDILFIYSR